MIEFNGYLYGAAEDRFYQKSRDFAQNIMLLAVLIVFPSIVVFFGIRMKSWQFVLGYCSLFVLIPLLARIPKSKKERHALTPKRIYVEDDHIVCICDRYTESRLVSDVTKVINCGEFYELCFSFGKFSEKFICQKNLLTRGTLEEFEALFEGKVQSN